MLIWLALSLVLVLSLVTLLAPLELEEGRGRRSAPADLDPPARSN